MNSSTSPGWSGFLWKMPVRLLVLCASWVLALGLQAQAPAEYAEKAAFLAKITQFVKWPPPAGSAITVGLLGEDSIGGPLAGLINVKRAKRIEDLKDCQVIFIGKAEQGRLNEILAALEGTNILTVGESEGFAKQGGAIGLIMEGDKVRMEINPGAAKRAGLGIDLRLLKLAARVFNS